MSAASFDPRTLLSQIDLQFIYELIAPDSIEDIKPGGSG